MVQVSLAPLAFLHFQEWGLYLFCLQSSHQSLDLNHSQYLTGRPASVSQGQAALWDAVGAKSNSASCCPLPFSWAASATVIF